MLTNKTKKKRKEKTLKVVTYKRKKFKRKINIAFHINAG